MSRIDYYPATHYELMPKTQFRALYTNVLRVAKLAGRKEIMNFGPSLCDLDAAMEEGFIGSSSEFKPNLFAASVDMPVSLEGDTYDTARVFFRGGNGGGAAPEWLGDLTFQNGQKQLTYKFRGDATIVATRCAVDSPWHEELFVREPQATNLQVALEVLKQDLHERNLGGVALSEMVSNPDSLRKKAAHFLGGLVRRPLRPSPA